MSRISTCFSTLAQANRQSLIPFMTAGDPEPGLTVEMMHALVSGGADVIELGVPFSDPMADGPVIQLASERALAHNTSLRDVLAMVAQFRQSNDHTSVVLMGYLNPIEVMGYETFAKAAAKAGVDGTILVDLPPEEAEQVIPLFRQQGIDSIFLISPTTTQQRIEKICAVASGYLYYVSLKGVTGSNALDVNEVAGRVETIRNTTRLPIGVGFGIKDAETAALVSSVADGVVVGSALVNIIADYNGAKPQLLGDITAFMQQLRQAMDQS